MSKNNGTISVEGYGQLEFAPDLTQVKFYLYEHKDTYEAVCAAAIDDIAVVKQAVTAAGFTDEEVKSDNFTVSEKTRSIKDKDGNYSDSHEGYEYQQLFTVSFGADGTRLNRLLSKLSTISCCTDLNVNYTIKDIEKCMVMLAEEAAKDAKAKASVIAEALGSKLGKIIMVEHDSNNSRPARFSSHFSRENVYYSISPRDKETPVEILPGKISVSNSISVHWNILPVRRKAKTKH